MIMGIDSTNIYKSLEAFAKDEGFSAIGCAKAERLDVETINAYNNARMHGYFADLDYLHRNCDKRFNPSLLVENTKSILVFLAPYGKNGYVKEQETSNFKISQYAIGEDYHKVIKNKLYTILEKLNKIDNSVSGRPFTDSAPILERAWARRAGLGFIGKNNFLISPQNGIRNFIGTLFINIELPYNKSIVPQSCAKCNKCIESCPTGALISPYTLDANRCISYLTVEKKTKESKSRYIDRRDILKNDNVTPIEGWAFGCDICMNVCPWNIKNKPSWSEFL